MAKERDTPGVDYVLEGGTQEGGESSKENKTKKHKKKGKKDGKKRPRFCPNSSKSFNQSRTFNQHRQVSVSALKKNNEELARTLNIHKSVIAELKADKIQYEREIQDMREELVHLRADRDPVLVEAEVQRRLTDVLGPVKGAMDRAIDNMVGLSENLTQGVRLVNNTLRQSSAPRSTGSRSSSIGPSIQMRPVAGTSRFLPSGNSSSPTKGPVSKVTPMVAGHAISRPRIQLTKMDNDAMSAAMDRQQLRPVIDQQEESGPEDEVEEETDVVDEDEIDLNMSVSSPPGDLGRNRFNLTNIGEESTLDESRIVENIVEENEVEMSTILTPVEESSREELNSPEDVPIRRRVSSIINRTSTGVRRSTRSPVTEIVLSPRSPQVNILSSERHSAAVLSPLALGETPVLPIPTPVRSSGVSFDDFPEDPTESFLESLADDGEGPSWLFDTKKDKKRRSAARKLSSVWSEDEGRGTTSSGRRGTSSGLDSSDLSLTRNDTTGDDESEVSGYILSEDLVNNPSSYVGKTRSPSLANLKLALSMSSPGVSPSSANTTFSDAMEMTGAIVNTSDQENQPTSSRIDEMMEITVSTDTSRTPLREMSSEEGQVVRYNPKLETGVTVAGLKKAHIQLNNVGLKRLSDCYINICPGRSLSLDQVLNLGLQAGISSPCLSASPRGKKSRIRDSVRISNSAVTSTSSLSPRRFNTEASTSVLSSCKDSQQSDSGRIDRTPKESSSTCSPAANEICDINAHTSIEVNDRTEMTVQCVVERKSAVEETNKLLDQINKVQETVIESGNNEEKEDTCISNSVQSDDLKKNGVSRTSRVSIARHSKSPRKDTNSKTSTIKHVPADVKITSTLPVVHIDSTEATVESGVEDINEEEEITQYNSDINKEQDIAIESDVNNDFPPTSRVSISRQSKSPSKDQLSKISTLNPGPEDDEITPTVAAIDNESTTESIVEDIHEEEIISHSKSEINEEQDIDFECLINNDEKEENRSSKVVQFVDYSKDAVVPRSSRVRSSVNYAAYLNTPEGDKGGTSKKVKSRSLATTSITEKNSKSEDKIKPLARTSVAEKNSKSENKGRPLIRPRVSEKMLKSEDKSKPPSKTIVAEKLSKSEDKGGSRKSTKEPSCSSSVEITENETNATRGRRRAAVSYIEKPLNKKMRRS